MCGCRRTLLMLSLAEVVWNGAPSWVRVPYVKVAIVDGSCFPSSTGPVKSGVNLSGPPDKPKYFLMTDSGPVP